MNPYEPVSQFEKVVAQYAGAAYGVAVNSCTNAIMLSLKYVQMQGGIQSIAYLPARTYVGVAYAALNAGYICRFRDYEWRGAYEINIHRLVDTKGTAVIDSARRFYSHMYEPGSLYCLSFHETKHLPIGDGGMILTDNRQAAETLRKMRFDGRTIGVPPSRDNFTLPGYHCHMKPDVASRGLLLMAGFKDFYEDLPNSDYPDLREFPIFQRRDV